MAGNCIAADRNFAGIIRHIDGSYSAKAPAKINRILRIRDKDPVTGLHNIESVMLPVSSPVDELRVWPSHMGDFRIEGSIVCNKDSNILLKTKRELERAMAEKGVRPEINCIIRLHKEIPIGSGMGGGSSDAAAFLRIANRIFSLGFNAKEMVSIALRIGSDVPFFLNGGHAIVNGSNTQIITPLECPNLYYVIARPHMRLETKEMYSEFDRFVATSYKSLPSPLTMPDELKLLGNSMDKLGINGRTSRLSIWTGPISNDFMLLAAARCSDVLLLMSQMSPNAAECGLTGKGPTVFAGFDKTESCNRCADKILPWFNGDIFIARPVDRWNM